MTSKLSAFYRAFADLLLPPRCVGCDATQHLEADDPYALTSLFCAACLPSIDEPSSASTIHREPLAQVHAPYVYGGSLADAIVRLKYHGRAELAKRLARLWRPLAHELRADLVVPVPLHPRRLQQRGYNQAALLARAAPHGARVDTAALRRVRDTPAQASLSADDRRHALRDAFVAPRPVAGHVLLVDDVTTTGATLRACARALLDAGAARVDGLTLAVTERREPGVA